MSLLDVIGAGSDLLDSLLGTTVAGTSAGTSTGTATETITGATRKGLEIDPAAIEKIVADALGSEQGLAEIFSKENVAGIFGSSVAAQASGDLISKITGEIAKLTAVEYEEVAKLTEAATTQQTTAVTEQEDEGWLDWLF